MKVIKENKTLHQKKLEAESKIDFANQAKTDIEKGHINKMADLERDNAKFKSIL